MFGKKETFRKAALERLSSPERLDEMMRNTPPKGWLAWLTASFLAGLTALWAFFGSIPNRVTGQGLLIPGVGVHDVQAPTAGIVTRLIVKIGDNVMVGDRVAVLSDPNVAGQLKSLERELESLEIDDRKARSEEDLAKSQSTNTYAMNERTYRSQITIQQSNLATARERLSRMEASGSAVYGEQDKAPLRAAIKQAEDQVVTLQAQVGGNSKAKITEENSRESARRQRQQKTDAKKSAIAIKRLVQGQILKATHSGRVFDVLIDEGSTVTPKQSLVKIEETGQPLQAFIYVASRAGQNVSAGDTAQISPSNVKKEEFGTIRAKVVQKNDYASSKQGIINDIRNETLAEEYTKQGSPMRLIVNLEEFAEASKANPALSGYRWTSGKGPERKILSGTPCDATVITGYSRPIDQVLTWIKTTTGM